MIQNETVTKVVVDLLRMASTGSPPDVVKALEEAYEREDSEVPKMQMKAIMKNIEVAKSEGLPLCQDTGVHIFFVKGNLRLIPSFSEFEDAIKKGVEKATEEVPLRPNAVHPITRKNPGNNIGKGMPAINYIPTDDPYVEIIAFPKGAGSENMSFMKMLTPSQGLKGIKEFVLDCVIRSGGKPCTPTVIGVGIGGTSDIAMHIAKESLLRPIGERHPEKEIAELEEELMKAMNETGIGPMGLGGKTTVLDVKVEYAYCHTASLPVAVNTQCWTGRRARAKIYEDGRIEEMEG